MSTPRIRGILPISVVANQVAGASAVAGFGRGVSCRAGRRASALPLLVAGVLADDVHLAAAANDLAVLADPLDAGSNLHRTSYSFSNNAESDLASDPSSVSGRRAVRLVLWPGLPVLGRIRPIYTAPGHP